MRITYMAVLSKKKKGGDRHHVRGKRVMRGRLMMGSGLMRLVQSKVSMRDLIRLFLFYTLSWSESITEQDGAFFSFDTLDW